MAETVDRALSRRFQRVDVKEPSPEEALRILRGRNELKVMVRYPKSDRENINSLNSMFIRTFGKQITKFPF